MSYLNTTESDGVDAETESCPECGGHLHLQEDVFCPDCGLVIKEEKVDRGPEYRIFSPEDESKIRAGPPRNPQRHDHGLSTEIGYDTDSSGNPLSPKKQRRIKRMRRLNNRIQVQSKADRNLITGFRQIMRIGSALDFSSSLVDQACALFREAQDERLLVGRSIEGIAAACVYAICRRHGRNIPFGEFKSITHKDIDHLKHCYKKINTKLQIAAKPPLIKDVVPRIMSNLGVGDRVNRRARKYAVSADKLDQFAGCSPSGVGGACVYIAALEEQEDLTLSDVSEAAHRSTMTIRSHYETILDHPEIPVAEEDLS